MPPLLISILLSPFLILYITAWALHPIGHLAVLIQYFKRKQNQKKFSNQDKYHKSDNKYKKLRNNLSKTKISILDKTEKLIRKSKKSIVVGGKWPTSFMVNFNGDVPLFDSDEGSIGQGQCQDNERVEGQMQIAGSSLYYEHDRERRDSREYHKSQVEIPLDPQVTIIKPLKGVDDHLEKNLKSFLNLNYSNFKVHFCIDTISDPSYPLICRLIEEYPNKAVLHIQELEYPDFFRKTGSGTNATFKNPKVANCSLAWKKTENDSELVWVADSKIYAKPETLNVLVSEIEDKNSKVACVHANPLFLDCHRFTAEKVYFYTQHSRSYWGGFWKNVDF